MLGSLPMTLRDVDVIVEVDSFFKQPALGPLAVSDMDGLGYVETEYRLFSEGNQELNWSLSYKEQAAVEQAIEAFFVERQGDSHAD